eukprot:6044377-Amphidinium_carterae.1
MSSHSSKSCSVSTTKSTESTLDRQCVNHCPLPRVLQWNKGRPHKEDVTSQRLQRLHKKTSHQCPQLFNMHAQRFFIESTELTFASSANVVPWSNFELSNLLAMRRRTSAPRGPSNTANILSHHPKSRIRAIKS